MPSSAGRLPAGYAGSAKIQTAGREQVLRRRAGRAFQTGGSGSMFLASIPARVDAALLERGRQRFDIFCSPCHGRLGNGDGMIARRGFKAPADLASDRVRQAPPGYIFQVIRNGYGAMGDYRDQVSAADAWAIVAYIRALELSRGATIADVPPEQQGQLEARQ